MKLGKRHVVTAVLSLIAFGLASLLFAGCAAEHSVAPSVARYSVNDTGVDFGPAATTPSPQPPNELWVVERNNTSAKAINEGHESPPIFDNRTSDARQRLGPAAQPTTGAGGNYMSGHVQRQKPTAQQGGEIEVRTGADPEPRPEVTLVDIVRQAGSGELIIPNHDGQTNVPVPLDHTDVSAKIQGYIASVHVAQRYKNPFSEKIEAVYVFPLPQDAAVSEFVMTIGDRHIRGIIREKAEAERIYHEARAQGYVASLLTQDRPNIFTQSVANIEPNKQIDIDITYFNTMAYVDGSYEFVFPMVVGPRFNPPGSTEGVGAVSRGRQGISGQKTELQYLRPDERSGHDIALSVDLNAGVPIEKLESANHKINVKQESPGHAVVTLDPSDSIPNKDFVLRYKVAGGAVKSAMFVQRDNTGGYFTLMLFPPASLSDLPRQPMEMVFTIDVSGSQSGAPLAQEKAATRYCLQNMIPGDTFQIVRFGNTAKTLFPVPAPVNRNNVQEALSYVDSLDANEGTMLVDGVHASLQFPHDPSRLRFVAFMTDGFIGNEERRCGRFTPASARRASSASASALLPTATCSITWPPWATAWPPISASTMTPTRSWPPISSASATLP
jgi:hypothetical protein